MSTLTSSVCSHRCSAGSKGWRSHPLLREGPPGRERRASCLLRGQELQGSTLGSGGTASRPLPWPLPGACTAQGRPLRSGRLQKHGLLCSSTAVVDAEGLGWDLFPADGAGPATLPEKQPRSLGTLAHAGLHSCAEATAAGVGLTSAWAAHHPKTALWVPVRMALGVSLEVGLGPHECCRPRGHWAVCSGLWDIEWDSLPALLVWALGGWLWLPQLPWPHLGRKPSVHLQEPCGAW